MLLYLALIIFFLLSLYRVKLGLFLLLTLVPAYLLRTQIWFVPTTFLELMIYALFAAWLIKKLIDARLKQSCLSALKNIYLALLLLFIALIISIFISPDKLLSLGILKGWFIDPFLLFLILKDTFKAGRNSSTISPFLPIIGLLFSGLIISLYGLYDFFLLKNLTIPGRLDSFFTSPNYVSLYLTPLTVLCLGIIACWFLRLKDELRLSKEKWIYFVFFSFSCLVFILTLYLTKSFSSWIALLAGMFFLWIFLPQKKLKIISLILGLLILCPVLIKEYKTSNFLHKNDFFQITSLESRADIWQGAWGLISENPILGLGLGNFKNAFPEYVQAHPKQFPRVVDFHNALFAHNLYLTFWLETGILGLLAFIWLLIIFYRKNWQKYKSSHNYFYIIVISGMTALLIHGLFDTPYFKNDLAVLFWVIYSVSTTPRLYAANKKDSATIA